MSEEKDDSPTKNRIEEKTEAEKLESYAGRGLRGPRFGVFEQLICQHLVQATVSADSLRKVQLVCEAGLMVSEDKQKALGLDMDRLEVVRVVTEAFQHKVTTNPKKTNMTVNSIKFGFATSEENYVKYVSPWWTGTGLNYYPTFMPETLGKTYVAYFCMACQNFVADSISDDAPGITKDYTCKYCGNNLNPDNWRNPQPFYTNIWFKPKENVPYWKLFFGFCMALTPTGYTTLKTPFLKWAVPFAMKVMRKLTEVVRPEIYSEIAKMFVKAKREEKSEFKG